MKVSFRNGYTAKVWVAIMRYDPGTCGEYGNWATEGWWGIDPGQQVWAFSTDNRYAAYYAKSDDGRFWSGDFGPVYVYHNKFDSCVGLGSTAAYDIVGMRLIDTNGSDVTLNLVL